MEEGDNRMENLLGTAAVVEIVEDAGVPPAAVPHVSAIISAVVAGTSSTPPRLTRKDLLLHIERSRNR